jgi:hypothetical protein
MQIFKKIIRYILLGIIGLFIIFIIALNVSAHVFGYHKVDAFFSNVHYPIGYFKKSAFEEITIESLYTNRFNDSIFILKYANSFEIALWVIKQNDDATFTNIIDTNQNRLIADHFFSKVEFSHLTIEVEAFKHDFKDVTVHFYNCRDIEPIINNKTCQFYNLKAGAIYLTTNYNSYYDIYMGLNNSKYSDFMIFTANNRLCLLVLYPINSSYISPDALKEIINPTLI